MQMHLLQKRGFAAKFLSNAVSKLQQSAKMGNLHQKIALFSLKGPFVNAGTEFAALEIFRGHPNRLEDV